MAEPRLTSAFWVQAYRRRLDMLGIPVFVVAHGDDTAGAVLIKLNTLDGNARLFTRRFDLMEDRRRWEVLAEGGHTDVDAAITRERGFDPDLWVLEIEDREGRHMLDEPGFA
ncbi:MAG: DUF1491 family protein [Rhodobacteraceae bacterium]|nr:DUF1491 family protein [Paracoccaceae bacterium]